MAMQEYKIKDPSYGSRTFQWDTDLDKNLPKGAKAVGSVDLVEPPEDADPAPVLDSQEPGNVLEETARGQATQADVDAAEKAAAEPANKARKASNK